MGKPVPTSLREWVREVVGVHKFLRRLGSVAAQSREGWPRSQFEYYTLRLDELLSHPPHVPRASTWRKIVERSNGNLS